MNILYGTQVVLIIMFAMATLFFISPNINKHKSLEKWLLLFFQIVLIVTAVTRPETTADTDNYIYAFKSPSSTASRLEPMFFIIIKIARLFSNPVIVGLTIYALLSIVPRFFFIGKQSINVWASVMVYMSYCYEAQDIVAIRSAVASVIVLYIIQFKLEGKIKEMVIAVIIATLFHYSAMIFLVLLLVNPNKEHRLLYLSMLLGSYVLYFVGFDICTLFPYLKYFTFLDFNLTNYSMSTDEVFGTLNGPQILRLTTCMLFWLYSDKIKDFSPYSIIYLKVFTISLCMFPLFSSVATMGYRFYELFASAEAIGLPILFTGVFRKRLLNRAAIIVYTFYFFFVSITSIAYWDPVLN